MNLIEYKNPFRGGKIISANTNPAVYHNTGGKRGQPDFVMSRSELMLFDHCPFRWLNGYKRKDTEEMEWGSLLDAMVLNSERFWDDWAVCPATYPAEPKKKGFPIDDKPWNRNATFCREWEATQQKNGKQIVKREQYGMAGEAKDCILKDAVANELIHTSKHQVMAIAEYHDADTGLDVSFKLLMDMVPLESSKWMNALADLKSTASCAERKWRNHVFDFALHVQGASYLDAYNAITGEQRDTFLHIVQENYDPWHVERRMLSQEFLALGRMQYVQALKRYCQCLKTNEWPGYECREIVAGFGVINPEAWMVM